MPAAYHPTCLPHALDSGGPDGHRDSRRHLLWQKADGGGHRLQQGGDEHCATTRILGDKFGTEEGVTPRAAQGHRREPCVCVLLGCLSETEMK